LGTSTRPRSALDRERHSTEIVAGLLTTECECHEDARRERKRRFDVGRVPVLNNPPCLGAQRVLRAELHACLVHVVACSAWPSSAVSVNYLITDKGAGGGGDGGGEETEQEEDSANGAEAEEGGDAVAEEKTAAAAAEEATVIGVTPQTSQLSYVGNPRQIRVTCGAG
jgi:hypothetical protein